MKIIKPVSVFLLLLAAGAAILKLGIAAEPAQTTDQQKNTPATPWSGEYSPLSDEQLKARLTPLQYEVTQQEGTERAFSNPYWDNKEEGIYVDIVSGEPLFSSTDKFKSGTGWPSFTQPITADSLQTHTDTRFFMKRVELKSSMAGSHLGHVFEDGPQPTGLRYCINSASLRFVPKSEMAAQGYGEYLGLFEN